jgi:15-cis-phytoene synthase
VKMTAFNAQVKAEIEEDIRKDFDAAIAGIRKLPASSRFGVYVAYVYYRNLFRRIRATEPRKIMETRIRVPDYQKIGLLASSYFRHQLGMF